VECGLGKQKVGIRVVVVVVVEACDGRDEIEVATSSAG